LWHIATRFSGIKNSDGSLIKIVGNALETAAKEPFSDGKPETENQAFLDQVCVIRMQPWPRFKVPKIVGVITEL
jgi:hypothetical protein